MSDQIDNVDVDADADGEPFDYAGVGMDEKPTAPIWERPRNFRLCYDDDIYSDGDSDGDGDSDSEAIDDDDDDKVDSSSSNRAATRPQPWGIAPIEFLYSIETNVSSSLLSPRAKHTIVSSVSAAIIDSIYEHDCPPHWKRRRGRRRQRGLSDLSSSSLSGLRSRSRSRSRRTEILSISPGDGHEWIGECGSLSSSTDNVNANDNVNDNDNEDTNDNDNANGLLFCNQVEGNVVIGFDEMEFPGTKVGPGTFAADFKSVGNVVLSRIEEDMINGIYLEKVNSAVLEFGVSVTTMKYIDSVYPDLVDQNAFAPLGALSRSPAGTPSESSGASFAAADTTNMTLFSKIAIPIMVILFVVAMALCWCAISSWPTDWFLEKKRTSTQRKIDVGEQGGKPHKKYSLNQSIRKISEGVRANRNSGRDTGPQHSLNNVSPPASITIKTKSDNAHTKRHRNDKDKHEDCENRPRTPSLEATLQDLTETERMKYGDQGAPYSISGRRGRTYSTLPIDNSRAGVNRFLPIVVRPRPHSMIRVADGSSNTHPSDTETGSTAPSVGIINDEMNSPNNYRRDRSSVRNKVGFVDLSDSDSESESDDALSTKKSSASRGLFSSFFKNRTIEPPRNTTSVINLVDRVGGCTSGGDSHCFRDDSEMAPPTNNNTILRYVIPTAGRNNSLLEVEKPMGDKATSPSSRMSAKKAIAYRAYINKKMIQRAKEFDQELSIPMEIGVKRSFMDDRGYVREMVAL